MRADPDELPRELRFPSGLDAASFLRRFWQRQPIVMRRALPGFASPISPDELAGLACEEEVESRLVLERDGKRPWEVRHGPFAEDDFAALPPTHWTLLVQDVDKHLPEVARWRDAFRFIPHWRADDIMISYAEDGGSVGPHLDEYDVFLIQAEGRRRWLIDPSPAFEAPILPGLDLRILADFQARKTQLLEPGDLLYLPPGVPHWGIAEGPCMTWSVGFRAPAWGELAASWCEHSAQHRLPPGRYRDPGLRPQTRPGEILPAVFKSVRETLSAALCHASEQELRAWFGGFVTEPKEQLEVYPAEAPIAPDDLLDRLAHRRLRRNGYSRMAFCHGPGNVDLLFVNGSVYEIPASQGGLLALITAEPVLAKDRLLPWLHVSECTDLLCRLYNEGHYEFVD
jgi:50S ribosomal protein L16 3-hydroxylase